jgi:hypothetical protein
MMDCFEILIAEGGVRTEGGPSIPDYTMTSWIPDEAMDLLGPILEAYGQTPQSFASMNFGNPTAPWALACLDREYAIAGHVATSRIPKAGIWFAPYSGCPSQPPEDFTPGVGMLVFESKVGLETCEANSPLFGAAWSMLRHCSAEKQWLIILDPLNAGWLADVLPGDRERWLASHQATTLALHSLGGHLFLEANGALWLVDTGAPASFASSPALDLAGERFSFVDSYMGFDAGALSGFVGVNCAGLLGANVLGHFDLIFDVPNGSVTISTSYLPAVGRGVPLEEVMGIPAVSVRIGDAYYRMFLDTGAPISYFQHDSLPEFPAAGRVTDFYPGIGQFETDTYTVDSRIRGVRFSLRSGKLPGPLAANLMMKGIEGIVGNAIFGNRRVGYFPRRRLLVL